jgi:hypothetical protein
MSPIPQTQVLCFLFVHPYLGPITELVKVFSGLVISLSDETKILTSSTMNLTVTLVPHKLILSMQMTKGAWIVDMSGKPNQNHLKLSPPHQFRLGLTCFDRLFPIFGDFLKKNAGLFSLPLFYHFAFPFCSSFGQGFPP